MATMPQFVPKFSTPQITPMARGVRENIAPYPEPMSAETTQKREAWFWMKPEARRTCPTDRMRAERIRKNIREIVNRDWRGGREARELAAELRWCPVGAGASKSVMVPKRIRATVEVIATIETWVAAVVGTIDGLTTGG